jgi:hypothetical protein
MYFGQGIMNKLEIIPAQVLDTSKVSFDEIY